MVSRESRPGTGLFWGIVLIVFVLPVSSLAQITFERTYGGGDSEWAWAVQQTSDGGYATVGYTSSFGVGGHDVYLIKTDSLGNILWDRTYGGASGDEGRSVQAGMTFT